jgi:phosphoribosylglycinamide formyltransferase-1
VLKLVVLISGSGSNLRALLEASHDESFPAKIVAVGADNDASGLAHAVEFGVPTFVVKPTDFDSRESWGEALIDEITAYSPDLVICAGFMRILPANVVAAFSPNFINLHPALLPLYPGAHAVRDALADGATMTGATVHIVDEGVDTGPVIDQVEVAITADDSEASLHERIKIVERELIVRTVRNIAHTHVNLQELARS